MSETYYDADGKTCTLESLCRTAPEWAAARVRSMSVEIARVRAELARIEAKAAALRAALISAVDCWGRPGHHEDDCPGLCEEHNAAAQVKAALSTDSGAALLTYVDAFERWLVERASCETDEIDTTRGELEARSAMHAARKAAAR